MAKTKGISFRLSESEYDKVQDLADQRHMTATEYVRHVALGNRIKPTVIKKDNSNTNDALIKENEKLKMELLKADNSMTPLSKYVSENGFMNWHEYKNDEKVISILKYIHKLKNRELE